jgi:hypothetical protein
MSLNTDILAYWNFNDNGSGEASLADNTGLGNTLAVYEGTAGSAAGVNGGLSFLFDGATALQPASGAGSFVFGTGDFSVNFWIYPTDTPNFDQIYLAWGIKDTDGGFASGYNPNAIYAYISNFSETIAYTSGSSILDSWYQVTITRESGTASLYINGSLIGTANWSSDFIDGLYYIGRPQDIASYYANGRLDLMGVWDRALSSGEVTELYNGGSGLTYPFQQTPLSTLYYNNAENDGDWGNLLNWWQDDAFTIQAIALPTTTNPINLYNEVTQNTEGLNQCFCSSASFWSANFGAGLTLQASGVVNMQGTSLLAGTTTDGVSMHDSSQLTATSVVYGNVTMRDSSRAFGSILGNATIYYDGGNGQYPIGGTVAGSVTYLGWPAVTPQWFNDQAEGGANNGDFSDFDNWWTDDTYTTRPINSVGTQVLPDASTDVFIAPNTGIVANSGTANPTVNSVTANNSNIQNISLTATNGFLFSGNDGVANAVLYGDVIFQDTAYNDHAVIQGKATYKSAASLQYSWGENSLGNVNAGMYNGSTAFEVNISGGGGVGGTISRLLNLPWFINI